MKLNIKYILLPIFILINIATIYFWVFPFQKLSNFNDLKIVDVEIEKQNRILINVTDDNLKEIRRNKEIYPIFTNQFDSINIIDKHFDEINQILKRLRKELIYGSERFIVYTEPFEEESLTYRMHRFHYQMPKEVLFEKEKLVEAIIGIDTNQTIILNHISDEKLKQYVQDDYLIDTKALPKLLHRKSVSQILLQLRILHNKSCLAHHHIMSISRKSIEQKIIANELKHLVFIPTMSARKTVLKKGELFEAEFFLGSIFTHDSLKYFVNNEPVPIENGIATYEYTPKSKGTKVMDVRAEYNNALYDNKKRTYRREFEVLVSDCN